MGITVPAGRKTKIRSLQLAVKFQIFNSMTPSDFNPGIDIKPLNDPLGFQYGEDVFGPEVSNRTLDSIRSSLKDPDCDGPEIVYAIAMDVGKKIHQETLVQMNLLFGVVTYAAGSLGEEPIRSQGHVHKVSLKSGYSTPEVYEIWTGKAIIYMQESANYQPGRCFAVKAEPGDVVIVPPGWVHATISADSSQPLTFGAWCDRDYGYEYDQVREKGGIAWFPLIGGNNEIVWEPNANYERSELIIKSPADYSPLGIEHSKSIYGSFEKNPETFMYVPEPLRKNEVWSNYIP
jgi:glucose-6-phosphate isomerase